MNALKRNHALSSALNVCQCWIPFQNVGRFTALFSLRFTEIQCWDFYWENHPQNATTIHIL